MDRITGKDGTQLHSKDGRRGQPLLVHRGTLKSYPGLPHGMPTTRAGRIKADLPAFIQP